jgi:hippurate hydrolase
VNGLIQALRGTDAEFTALRHDLHQHPELGFAEQRTAGIVAERLRSWGYDVHTGIGVTGVVGQLVRGKGLRRLGLRADMDALPIQEATGLAHASRIDGKMHACGHDGHTAMLLAAAKYLAQNAGFDGTLNLIFQPAEEGGGGAPRMMQDGLFERFPCDAIFAMHNMPGFEQGRLVFREGPSLASSDHGVVTLTGVGGHGAIPQKTADPVVAAAAIVMALQTVVARNVDPQQMGVVTVGMLHAGTAYNVIPGTVSMELSLRALDPGVRELLMRRVQEIIEAQAAGFNVAARVEWVGESYPVLVNTPGEVQFAREVGLELVGPGAVTLQGPALTGSEDFAFMLQRVKGCFLLIGNGLGDAKGACMVHNAGYDFDDRNLAIGAAYWVLLTERFLRC